MKIMDLGHYYHLFANYCVAPELLRPMVPETLELDLFEGKGVVSWIASTWQEMRVLGLPWNLKEQSFSLVLRTYVKKRGDNEWLRGYVYLESWMSGSKNRFFQRCLGLGDSKTLEVERSVHFEPYEKSSRGIFEYRWKDSQDKKLQSLRFRTMGSPQPAMAGYLEHFTSEKKMAFLGSKPPFKGVQEERAPWVIWEIDEMLLPQKWPAANQILSAGEKPHSVFVAKGSKSTYKKVFNV